LVDNFEPSLRIGFLMALLTRSMILLLFFFLLITHSHSYSHSLTHSLSFIDNAAYVRFGVGSRQRVRHINACPTTTRGTVGNERETKERSRKEKEKERKQKWGRIRKEGNTPFFSSFLPSFLSLSIQNILTTYNSDPMDGLREIHFGERSLSLSHLYKNDSRRCIPLLFVVVVPVLLFVPCCWLCGDVDDTLWWELRARADDDEPSTSKLK
jgi:hypothetical protein